MKNNVKQILIIFLSIVGGAVCSYLALQVGDELGEKSLPGTSVTKTKIDGSVKTVTKISLVDNRGVKAVKIVKTSCVRPSAGVPSVDAVADDVDEDDLTDKQKAVLKELREAVDANNLKRVRAVLSKFLAKTSTGGLEGNVPACLRAEAVSALGWFGKEAAVDLMSFVADPNEEIANDAFMNFESALSDGDMGDQERSKLMTSMLTALTDEDQIDSLLCQLNDMRNSVRAMTIREILTKSTPAAKKKMLEEMPAYLEDGIQTVDGVNRWEKMNPDEPEDAEMYGGKK